MVPGAESEYWTVGYVKPEEPAIICHLSADDESGRLMLACMYLPYFSACLLLLISTVRVAAQPNNGTSINSETSQSPNTAVAMYRNTFRAFPNDEPLLGLFSTRSLAVSPCYFASSSVRALIQLYRSTHIPPKYLASETHFLSVADRTDPNLRRRSERCAIQKGMDPAPETRTERAKVEPEVDSPLCSSSTLTRFGQA